MALENLNMPEIFEAVTYISESLASVAQCAYVFIGVFQGCTKLKKDSNCCQKVKQIINGWQSDVIYM